jgi:hypothetical protein
MRELAHVVQRLLDHRRVLRHLGPVSLAIRPPRQRPLRKPLHGDGGDGLDPSPTGNRIARSRAQGGAGARPREARRGAGLCPWQRPRRAADRSLHLRALTSDMLLGSGSGRAIDRRQKEARGAKQARWKYAAPDWPTIYMVTMLGLWGRTSPAQLNGNQNDVSIRASEKRSAAPGGAG